MQTLQSSRLWKPEKLQDRRYFAEKAQCASSLCISIKVISGPPERYEREVLFFVPIAEWPSDTGREQARFSDGEIKQRQKDKDMILVSKICDIIDQFNHNGIKPTCKEIAEVLANRERHLIGTLDLQDKLDEMVREGVILDEEGRYATNPSSTL